MLTSNSKRGGLTTAGGGAWKSGRKEKEKEDEDMIWSDRREGPLLKSYKAPPRKQNISLGHVRRATTSEVEKT